MSVISHRTKRSKGHTLPLLNEGQPFRVVKVNGKYAILKKTDPVSVVHLNDMFPKVITNDDVVEQCVLPLPPELAFEQEEAIIGGVGKTIRWKVVLPRRKNNNPALLFVANIFDKIKFEKFIGELQPFAFHNYTYEDTLACGYSTRIDIPDNTKTGMVAARLHYAGYGAVLETEECQGKLGVERFDRSDHMWWNQDPKTAGPLRDTHRWKYPWCDWKYLPFNWHLLAKNILIPTELCDVVPFPLRNYVLQSRMDRARVELEILRKENVENSDLSAFLVNEISLCSSMRKPHCVTARLTQPQTIQLLCATYYILVTPLDEELVKISNLLQYMYCIHGYIGREIGGYRQDANFLGHGAYIRNFKHKKQYDAKNIKTRIANKVIQADGSMKGTGFKGARGKYAKRIDKPRNRMQRTVQMETDMRTAEPNCFYEYGATMCLH